MVNVASPAPPDGRRRRMLIKLSGRTAAYVALTVIALAALVPMAYAISTSLKPSGQELTIPIRWIPNPVEWGNYLQIFRVAPLLTFFKNTMVITLVTLVGNVGVSALVAYAFARLRFPGRDALFVVVLSTIMLPYIVTLIPQFVLFRNVGMVNTLWPLIIPSLFGHPIYIFLLRQFFKSIPVEVEDAARLDGAGFLRTWWSIALPLARPGLATVLILSVLTHWNDFIAPLVYLNTQDKWTLSLAVNLFQGDFRINYNLMMAYAAVMTVPVVLVFFAFQKYFVRGITLSATAGR
ncbi:carbohydrate ABC transporter permease [Kribbella pittospori]|uniref:Carbohydrate ABC transporter permease n=1 Tax=Kribbella pittospori TaxID=722689 RepID=A0A4R0JGY5_9ACTN|nr:carbohydrate ABC transporter permease [Kribbella pittospori]TCC45380.1 carbohydrate ABC transporter permease [Kribbella pittospori]